MLGIDEGKIKSKMTDNFNEGGVGDIDKYAVGRFAGLDFGLGQVLSHASFLSFFQNVQTAGMLAQADFVCQKNQPEDFSSNVGKRVKKRIEIVI